MREPPDPLPPSSRRPTRQVSAPDDPCVLELHGLESGARSEGGLYAPPKTVPPVSDHKTIEMRTVDVRHAPDPSRVAVTERKLRAPPAPPPSSNPAPSSARAPSSTVRTVAPWLIALGAAVVLIAAFVALAHRASRAKANAPAVTSVVATPPPAVATTAAPSVVTTTAAPSVTVAPAPVETAVSPSATASANATAPATPSAKPSASHHAPRNQPLF
jgi:hypothetical protein